MSYTTSANLGSPRGRLSRLKPKGAELSLQRPRYEVLGPGDELCLSSVSLFKRGLNPRFPPTIRVSLTTSQVLRRPPEVT